jgi:hypothetical protein
VRSEPPCRPECWEFIMVWSRLIRFVDEFENTTFGEPDIEDSDDLFSLLKRHELLAIRLHGNDPFALSRTDDKVKVVRMLGVLDAEHVSVFKCIGLNYRQHSRSSPTASRFIVPRTDRNTLYSY